MTPTEQTQDPVSTPPPRQGDRLEPREIEVVHRFQRNLRIVAALTFYAAIVQAIGLIETLGRPVWAAVTLFRASMHGVAVGLWIYVGLRLLATARRLRDIPADDGRDLPRLFDGLGVMNALAGTILRIVAVLAALVVLALIAALAGS